MSDVALPLVDYVALASQWLAWLVVSAVVVIVTRAYQRQRAHRAWQQRLGALLLARVHRDS